MIIDRHIVRKSLVRIPVESATDSGINRPGNPGLNRPRIGA